MIRFQVAEIYFKKRGHMDSFERRHFFKAIISLVFPCLVLLVALGGARVFAQSTATLQGTVTDSTGAVIPSVNIVVHNQGTGVDRNSQTDASGNYQVPALEPGVYRVEARAQGFQTQVFTDLKLDVGSIVVQNIQLKVGAVTQE